MNCMIHEHSLVKSIKFDEGFLLLLHISFRFKSCMCSVLNAPELYGWVLNRIYFADLKTMSKRLESEQYYITFEMFVADVKRMLANARTYNAPETIYYKCATRYIFFEFSTVLFFSFDIIILTNGLISYCSGLKLFSRTGSSLTSSKRLARIHRINYFIEKCLLIFYWQVCKLLLSELWDQHKFWTRKSRRARFMTQAAGTLMLKLAILVHKLLDIDKTCWHLM